MLLKLPLLASVLGLSCLAQSPNWTGPYQPCRNSGGLKNSRYLHIGVRYDISDPLIVQQFHQAFAFWAKVLDADFYDDQSTSCAIAIVPATHDQLSGSAVAHAHLPDRANFQGWIAIDAKASAYLSPGEAVPIWTHEIGHLLGLKHNASPLSLMYFIDVDSTCRLDSTDLRALSRLHTLRDGAPVTTALWVKPGSDSPANGSSRQEHSAERAPGLDEVAR